MHDISLRRSRNPHADLPNSSLVRKVYVKAKIVVLVQQGINSSHTRLRTLEHPIGGWQCGLRSVAAASCGPHRATTVALACSGDDSQGLYHRVGTGSSDRT